MLKLITLAQAYLANKDGATAIEYGLIAAGISLAIVAVVFTFGEELTRTFEGMEGAMVDANARIGGEE